MRRSPLGVERKADESPVTIADRKAEEAMRKVIKERFPGHGIFGEEEGMDLEGADSGYLWVLDPIDGTKSFVTGAESLARGNPIPNWESLKERLVQMTPQRQTEGLLINSIAKAAYHRQYPCQTPLLILRQKRSIIVLHSFVPLKEIARTSEKRLKSRQAFVWHTDQPVGQG